MKCDRCECTTNDVYEDGLDLLCFFCNQIDTVEQQAIDRRADFERSVSLHENAWLTNYSE